jgi:phosphocarrier protein HPr
VSGAASDGNRHVRELKVGNHYGIHARPAALFVKAAAQFDADIHVEKDGSVVSGKSIMGLMTLEAGKGSTLRVTAEGVDGKAALDHLEELVVRRKFDED